VEVMPLLEAMKSCLIEVRGYVRVLGRDSRMNGWGKEKVG